MPHIGTALQLAKMNCFVVLTHVSKTTSVGDLNIVLRMITCYCWRVQTLEKCLLESDSDCVFLVVTHFMIVWTHFYGCEHQSHPPSLCLCMYTCTTDIHVNPLLKTLNCYRPEYPPSKVMFHHQISMVL